ncbi:MAG: RNA 2',3'-cyclic phosphodiesterase [Candidatus Omnitrophota bacterium]
MRCFIALEFSDEAMKEFLRTTDILRKADAEIKWLSADTVHLTLKFLGDIPEEKAPVITARLRETVRGCRPFTIEFSGIGVFPGWDRPKVLWIGVGKGAREVVDLASRVDGAMALEGFEQDERPFSPHITMGRIKGPKNKKKLEGLLKSIHVEPASSFISRIIVFKSVLTEKGAIHTPLDTVDLS